MRAQLPWAACQASCSRFGSGRRGLLEIKGDIHALLCLLMLHCSLIVPRAGVPTPEDSGAPVTSLVMRTVLLCSCVDTVIPVSSHSNLLAGRQGAPCCAGRVADGSCVEGLRRMVGGGLGLAQGCHSIQGHDLGGHAWHCRWRLLAWPQPKNDLHACRSGRARCCRAEWPDRHLNVQKAH